MLFLLAFSAAAASPLPVKVGERARASITILNAHRASPESWDPASRRHQREVIRKELDGAEVRLRLTEFE
jgi:hypothetical protein